MATHWAAIRTDAHGLKYLIRAGYFEKVQAEAHIYAIESNQLKGHNQDYSVLDYKAGISVGELLVQHDLLLV
jgi:hypothetical protein